MSAGVNECLEFAVMRALSPLGGRSIIREERESDSDISDIIYDRFRTWMSLSLRITTLAFSPPAQDPLRMAVYSRTNQTLPRERAPRALSMRPSIY